MAPESCNLGKDEAEILNPSSPQPSNTSLPSAPSQTIPQQSPSCLLLEPIEVVQAQRSERTEASAATAAAAAAAAAIKVASLSNPEEESQTPAQFGNRCSTCRKRIALSGFRCRCGDLFCSRHRYSDTHDCSFDYKAAGREEISKANPLVRAAKIIKI